MITALTSHSSPYVTVAELSRYWGVGRKLLYKQIDAGTLQAIRLGPRLLRVSTREAVRFEAEAKMASTREGEPIAVSAEPLPSLPASLSTDRVTSSAPRAARRQGSRVA
jgi:excisionase family DNA binding protein